MDARHVILMRGVEEEERLVLIARDEAAGFVGEGVAHRLVVPERGLATLHPADAADAVDECHIVAVGPIHLELRAFGIGLQVGVARIGGLVANFDGILGIEPDDGAVLDEDRRHAVARGGHDEGVSEADLIRRRVDLLIPVHVARAETEVPLTDHARGVAEFGEAGGHRRATRLNDEASIAGQHAGALTTPGVFARQERIARRRAGGGRAVARGEAGALRGKLIEIRGRDDLRAVAAEITPADIIGIEQDDVRRTLIRREDGEHAGQGNQGQEAHGQVLCLWPKEIKP